MKSPCFGCKIRVVGCHSNCADYVVFKNLLEVERKAMNRQRLIDQYESGIQTKCASYGKYISTQITRK